MTGCLKNYNVAQGGKIMDVRVIYSQDGWEGMCEGK